METTRHSWGEWESCGHGGGDGTPAGVISVRTCRTCRAQEWRDSAVSDYRGIPRPQRGYRDAYGDECDSRPECIGADPLAEDEEVSPEAARAECPAGACEACPSIRCPGKQ